MELNYLFIAMAVCAIAIYLMQKKWDAAVWAFNALLWCLISMK